MFKRKRRTGPVPIIDVFVDKRKEVLSLKKEEHYTIKLHKGKTKDFLKRHSFWITISAVFLIILFLMIKGSFTRAEVAIFNPTSCLGGWANAEKAVGNPDVSDDNDVGSFNDQNSAVLANQIGQIFCGSFEGDVPKDTKPKNLTLKFSWAYKTNETSTPTASSTDIITLPEDVVSTSTPSENSPEETTNPNPDQTPIETLPPDVSPTPPPESPTVEPSPEPPPVEVPPSNPSPSEPTSFLNEFVKKAVAQTFGESTSSDSSSDASSTHSIEETSQNQPPAISDAALEVLYTIDGVEWQSLGKVSKTTLSETTFKIPNETFSSWDNLSKFSVSIQGLPSFDEPFTIYLDGISLEIEYENAEPKSPKTFNIIDIKNGDKVALEVREDESNDDKLLISGLGNSLGGLFVYNLSEKYPILTTYVADYSYAVAASYFKSGNFVVTSTSEPAVCDHLSLDQCRSKDQYVGESSFRIVTKEEISTSTPEAALPSLASTTNSTE